MVRGGVGVEGWVRGEAAAGEGAAGHEQGEGEEGEACAEDYGGASWAGLKGWFGGSWS